MAAVIEEAAPPEADIPVATDVTFRVRRFLPEHDSECEPIDVSEQVAPGRAHGVAFVVSFRVPVDDTVRAAVYVAAACADQESADAPVADAVPFGSVHVALGLSEHDSGCEY